MHFPLGEFGLLFVHFSGQHRYYLYDYGRDLKGYEKDTYIFKGGIKWESSMYITLYQY
jgi:hypothetical protein